MNVVIFKKLHNIFDELMHCNIKKNCKIRFNYLKHTYLLEKEIEIYDNKNYMYVHNMYIICTQMILINNQDKSLLAENIVNYSYN